MRYCNECGKVLESDDAAFCGSCGAAADGAGAAAKPSEAATAAVVGGGLNKTYVMGAIAAVLVIVVGVALWAVFFRALSPVDYEDRAQEYVDDYTDAVLLIGDAIEGLRGSDGGFTEADVRDLKEDVSEGLSAVDDAVDGVEGLREPSEYESEAAHLVRALSSYREDYLGPLEEAVEALSSNDTTAELADRLSADYDGMERTVVRSIDDLADISTDLRMDVSLDAFRIVSAYPVTVSLTWSASGDADLDLQIAPASDPENNSSSWSMCGSDDTSGWDGGEYFNFDDYGVDGDYSQGEYEVSVYVCWADAGSAQAELTLTDAFGGQTTVSGRVFEDSSEDMWHAFRVDAATGAMTTVDYRD